MQGSADETVGVHFQQDLLQKARDKTLGVIEAAAAVIRPGMTELEAKAILTQIQAKAGAPKSWHPPQIRFGENTLCPFGKKGQENIPLKDDDIFFLDIGPIFENHEGDVGRPFVLGNDTDMIKCRDDIAQIWQEVRDHWKSKGVSGAELYAFAEARCEKRGWIFVREGANGHRIADFPHAARNRGSVEGFVDKPAANRWILEIQIRHPHKAFGAFYEDLLN